MQDALWGCRQSWSELDEPCPCSVLLWMLGFCLDTRTRNEPIQGEGFSWRPGSLPQTCRGKSSGGHAHGEMGVTLCRGLGMVFLLFLLGEGGALDEIEVGLE